MNDFDELFVFRARSGPILDFYDRLGIMLGNFEVEYMFNSVPEQVAELFKHADERRSQSADPGWSIDPLWWGFELAVELARDPWLQLEIACLIVQRTGTSEEPFCEHQFEEREFAHWTPRTVLHERIGGGPDIPESGRETILGVALQAYSNAWQCFARIFTAESHIGCVIAADGMRVCAEELQLIEDLHQSFEDLRWWLDDSNSFSFGWWDGDFDAITSELRQRFARTEGRLRPMVMGRELAAVRLEREFPDYWKLVPNRVQEDIVTAEYKRSVLKDQGYDLWDVAHSYFLAVERLVRIRIGTPVSTYLREATPEDRAEYRKLKAGRFKADSLTLHQYQAMLGEPTFRRILSKAGLDLRYLIDPPRKGRRRGPSLTQQLKKLIPHRTRAAHPASRRLTSNRLDEIRELVLQPPDGIIPSLAPVRQEFADGSEADND